MERLNGNILNFLQSVPVPRLRWLQIQYEELVQAPEAVMTKVCGLLDLPYEEALVNPYRGGRMTDGLHQVSLSIGDPNFLSHTQIDCRLADRWRSQLADMPVLEKATIELAQRLGYDFAVPTSAPELGPSQKQFFELFDESPRWNIVHRIRFGTSVKLDRDRFERCWQSLFQRHPQLRAFFVRGQNSYSQVISPHSETFRVHWSDLGKMPRDLQEQKIQEVLGEMNRSIDAEKWPLMCVTVVEREHNGFEMLWVYHHLIGDGVSSSIILGEILASYGDPDLEIPLPLATYSEYIKDVASLEATGELNEHIAFWQGQAYQRHFELPMDFASNGEPCMDTERELVIRQPLIAKSKRPLFEVFAVALYYTLADWTGCREPVISHRLHGRKTSEIFYHDVVGFFACDAPLCFPVNSKTIALEELIRFKELFRQMPLGGVTYSTLAQRSSCGNWGATKRWRSGRPLLDYGKKWDP